VLLSSLSEPNNVPALTETPGKTGSSTSDIVCATQWQPGKQANKGGFQSLLLVVKCGAMKAAVK